jgi:CRISPR-associated protein Cas2
MLILITYDVSTVEAAGRRRLRRVAQACEDYGTRVQKSVFECQVGQKEWARLRHRLLAEIKTDEDSDTEHPAETPTPPPSLTGSSAPGAPR